MIRLTEDNYSRIFVPGNLQIDLDRRNEIAVWTFHTNYKFAGGLGERFNGLNQKGKSYLNEVEEKFCNQGDKAYIASSFFLTDAGFGISIDTDEPLQIDFLDDKIVCCIPEDAPVTLFSGAPKEIVQEYFESLGGSRMLPDYAFGPWISANHWNSQRNVEEQVQRLENYQFPASVIVLEAWSDEATFYVFHGASYQPKGGGKGHSYEEFDFSQSPYWKDPLGMIQELHRRGLHLILWQIPVYKQQEENEPHCIQNELNKENAVIRKLCVMNADGTPYRIPEGHWFAGSYIPDFTNPQTVQSWFEQRQYLLDIGVDGFKTDGGEFIYRENIICHNKKTGRQEKNRYCQDYVGAYSRFIGQDHILFSRAGYRDMLTTPAYWAGDHMSTNAEFAATVEAGLSASLSGAIFWGLDIGGFAGPLPSADLYLRATMFACFCPIMQWHSEPDGGQFQEIFQNTDLNNERSPWNIAAHSADPDRTLQEIRYWHWLRMNLMPYILETAQNSVRNNIPVMRPLLLDFPKDGKAITQTDEYLFGDALLVAPLLQENEKSRAVYLPEGNWMGLFSGKCYSGGQEIISKERFPVYLREGTGIVMLGENRKFGIPFLKDTAKTYRITYGDNGLDGN